MAARARVSARGDVSAARAPAARDGVGYRPRAVPHVPARQVRLMQRTCVVGAGAIGSLYAAHIARVAESCVLTRRPEHAAALNAEGLRVSGRHEFTAAVTAAADPAGLPEPELVIVATKATGLEPAAASIAGPWPQANVMTVQNGLGAEEIVRRHGEWQLGSGGTFMSGTTDSD